MVSEYRETLSTQEQNNLLKSLGNVMMFSSPPKEVPKSVQDEWNLKQNNSEKVNFLRKEMKEEHPLIFSEWERYLQSREDLITWIAKLGASFLKIFHKWVDVHIPSDIFSDWRLIRNSAVHEDEWEDLDRVKKWSIEEKESAYVKQIERMFEISGWGSQEWLNYSYGTIVISEQTARQKGKEIPEDWMDKEVLARNAIHYTTTSVVIQSDKKNILKGLRKRGWEKYIEVNPVVEDGDEGDTKPAIDELCEILDKNSQYNVVEIFGKGGLGKTALMYEFVKRITDDNHDLDEFAEYIILTAKSEKQGEINPEGDIQDPPHLKETKEHESGLFIASPSHESYGPRSYVENLKFNNFIKIVNCFNSPSDSDFELDDIENALRLINENNWLIVLDNFEDVDKDDKRKYTKFFQKLNNNCKSRIIVTGRSQRLGSGFRSIQLGELKPDESRKLMLARYENLQQKYSDSNLWDWRTAHFNALKEDKYILNEILERISQNRQAIQEKLGHPIALFRLTTLMGKPESITEWDADRPLIDYLSTILADRNNGFNQFHDSLETWITDKAFNGLQEEECKYALEYLYHYGAKTKTQLKELFEGAEKPVTKVDKAIEILELEGVFIQKIEPDKDHSPYALFPSALRYLTEKGFFNTGRISSDVTDQYAKDLLKHLTDAHAHRLVNEIELMESKIRDFIVLNQTMTSSSKLDCEIFVLGEELLPHITDDKLRLDLTLELLDTCFSIIEDQGPSLVNGDKRKIWPLLQSILSVLDASEEIKHGYISKFLKSPMEEFNFSEVSSYQLSGWIRISMPQNLKLVSSWLNLYLTVRDIGISGLSLNGLEVYWPHIRNAIALDLDVNIDEMIWLTEKFSDELILLTQFDREWTQQSFDILHKLELLPDETRWENLLDWKRYSCPPEAPPGTIKISPSSWEENQGISFDYFNTINETYHFKIVDEYSTKQSELIEEDELENISEEDEVELQLESSELEFNEKDWIELHNEVINKLFIENRTGFEISTLQSRVKEKLSEIDWDKTGTLPPVQSPNRVTKKVTSGRYSRWGQWFPNFYLKDNTQWIIHHTSKKKSHQGILRRSGYSQLEQLNQKSETQELSILNQQEANDEIEQHFHTAKYTSSFKWRGVPIASDAREIILLLESQEKFWEFSRDSFESLYYSNSNLTLEVSHKVNNHKYFCPETNLLLKTWSNARIHKRNSGYTFTQKEMMVKHNQELIEKNEIYWDEPVNLLPSPEVYSQAVRKRLNSEISTPLELNIGSIVAFYHCKKHRHDFPFPPPSMKECKQYFNEYWKGQMYALNSGGGWKDVNEESIQHAEKYIQLWMNEVFSSKDKEESMEVEVTDSKENFILNQRVADALKRRPDPKDYAFWKTRKNVLLVQNLMIEFTGNGHDRPPGLIDFSIANIFEKLFTFRYHQSSEKFRYRKLDRCFSDILSKTRDRRELSSRKLRKIQEKLAKKTYACLGLKSSEISEIMQTWPKNEF